MATVEGIDVQWYRREEEENVVILAGIDDSEAYEVDQTMVMYDKSLGKFCVMFASGCSCWDGEASEYRFDTLDELEAFVLGEDCDEFEYKASLEGAKTMMAEARQEYAKFAPVV